MDAGLDIGTGALRAARGDAGSPSFDEQTPVALAVDAGDLAEIDRAADDLHTVEADDQLFVLGDDAIDVGDAAGRDPDSLLDTGYLPPDGWHPEAFAGLVEDALGPSAATDERLCYTTPGAPLDATVDTDAHREAVAGVLDDLGYDATPVSEGLAVIYDGLAAENLTGLGIAVREHTTSVCLAYYGVPVLVFSIARGAEWVEAQAAEATGQTTQTAAERRSSFVLDPLADEDDLGDALGAAYDDLVGDVLDAVDREAGEGDVREGVSVPVVLGGEGAVEGLEALFGARAEGADLPFSITDAVLADDPSRSTARGALAAAADDVDAYEAVTWSDSGDGGGVGGSTEFDAGGPTAAATDEATDGETGGGSVGDSTVGGTMADAAVEATGTGPADGDSAVDQLFERLDTRDEEIDDLDERLDDLGDRLAELLETLDGHGADLDDLEAAVDALDDRLADVDETAATVADLDAVRDSIDDLREDLSTLEGDAARETAVERLDEDLRDARTRIETVKEQVETVEGELEAEIETVEDQVETVEDELANEIEDVDGRIETTAADLEAVGDRVDTVEDDVDALDDETADLGSTLDTVRTDVDEIETDLAETASTVEDLGTDLDALETEVGDVDGRVGGLETDVDDLGTDFNDLETTVDEIETDLDDVSTTTIDLESDVES
ncbi:MAG TPA: hypothetical protein VJ898_11035, partial [Natrialbaceae archaeon]|nr:hypothetical protein [Natrialbaceae archaeon]